MRKALAVARWEYVEKIKSKAFLISLFLMPLIMLGLGILPALLATKPDTQVRILAIIDLTGELARPLGERLETNYKLPDGQPHYVLRPIDVAVGLAEARRRADEMVRANEIRGYLVVTPKVYADKQVEFRSNNLGMVRMFEHISITLRDILFERELQAAGVDLTKIRKLTRSVELKTYKITAEGEEEEGFETAFASAYIFMMMMFFLVVTSGQLLVRSIVEEKTNRVVEVLVSSCRALDLMVGKILGLSALAFTQIGFWAVIGVAISIKLGLTLISLSNALLLLVYFILGFLLYAAIFVAVGSPLSTEQEAQHVTSYLVIILIIPIVLAIPVLENPDSTLVKVLTFIPLVTPTMMAMRIPVQIPSTIEIVGSIMILALATGLAMWAAGKIFRTAILAYGKRRSIMELLRLLKTAS